MSDLLRHNGCDTLMLGFDHDLRRRGFAGNSCQIVLELSEAVDAARLQARVEMLVRQNPVLTARPRRGWQPHWKPTRALPKIRAHQPSAGLEEKLFNEPLAIRRGELIRFDLVGLKLIFTWSHALMDAKSAEYFLAVIGDESLSVPATGEDWYVKRALMGGGLCARIRKAWRSLNRLDAFSKILPVSPATHRPPTRPWMKYRVTEFFAAESVRIQANAVKTCGFLGDTNFHLAVTLMELHRLHQRNGCASASYVLPIPVSLRPKGTRAPLFSNQVTMALHQFRPGELTALPDTVAALKSRHAEFLRDDQLDAGITLGQLFRKLPLRPYMSLVKQALRGEICSLFFGDTGPADTALENFLGAQITSLTHIPAVTVPPGVGVVFNKFHGQLRLTLVYATGVLAENEAENFLHRLREHLLNP